MTEKVIHTKEQIEAIISRMMLVIRATSRQELAEDLGYSSGAAIGNWPSRGAQYDLIIDFAQRHGISLYWLLYGKGPRYQKDLLDSVEQGISLLDPEEEAMLDREIEFHEREQGWKMKPGTRRMLMKALSEIKKDNNRGIREKDIRNYLDLVAHSRE